MLIILQFATMDKNFTFSIYNLSSWNFDIQNYSNLPLQFNEDATELPIAFKVIITCLYVLTAIVSVIGNITLCYIIIAIPKRYNKCFYYLFVSSSVNDIFMSIVCIPTTVVTNVILYWWPLGTFACPVLQYTQLILVLHKSFSILSIVYGQHSSILKPLQKRLSRRSTLVILTVSWIIPVLVSIPTAMYSTLTFFPTDRGAQGLCMTVWPVNFWQSVYGYIIATGQFLVPFTVITYLCLRIGCKIWKNQIPGEPDVIRDNRLAKSKRKSIKILVAMVVIFFFTWTPLHILTLIGDHNPMIYNNKTIYMTSIVLTWLSLSNSATNCVCYYYQSTTFQIGLKTVISKVFCNRLCKDHGKQTVFGMENMC